MEGTFENLVASGMLSKKRRLNLNPYCGAVLEEDLWKLFPLQKDGPQWEQNTVGVVLGVDLYGASI